MRTKMIIERWSMGFCVLAAFAWLPACGGSSGPVEVPESVSDEDDAGQKALTQAIKAEESGDIEAAEMHYIKARELRPKHFETSERFVGFLLHKKRDSSGAVNAAKSFLDQAPDELGGYLLLADAQRSAGDLEAAQQTLSELILLDESASAYAKRGQIQVEQGEFDAGIADIRKAIELDGSNLDHRVALAEAVKAQGNLDEAARILQSVRDEQADHVGALLAHGAVLRDLGDADQAFELHQRAVELDGNNHRSHYELGISQFYLRQSEEAEASLERATQLDPRDAQSWYVYGELLRNREAFDQAADKYRKARDINIDHDKASTKLALMLINLETTEAYDEASTVLQARVERHPEDSSAYFLLGQTYEKQEKYREALDAYQRFVNNAERGDADLPQARRKLRTLKNKAK